MKKLLYILPALSLLCQMVEPAGRNLGLQQPFSSLPMLLTLAFMALSIAPWNEMYSDGGDRPSEYIYRIHDAQKGERLQ